MDCRERRQMRKMTERTLKNNARMLTGECVKCGRKINVLMGKKRIDQ